MNRNTQVLLAGAGTVVGLYAVNRAFSKTIHTLPYGYGIKLKKAVTVNGTAEHLYQYWRDLKNLPRLFENVLSVDVLDETHSHWTLKAPGGMTMEWDAEITVDRENDMIGWRSLDGADIDNAGYIRFERATGGRGTVVRVALQYNPPAGKLGAALSTLFGERPASQIQEALRKFKQVMETGEIPIAMDERKLTHSEEPVEAASEDSFPASDPPAWTGTTGPTG
ncbi:MAG TPA: SRPBCC family protein [Terriglobia bacterium]|jgi:uncharacterized membrane protein